MFSFTYITDAYMYNDGFNSSLLNIKYYISLIFIAFSFVISLLHNKKIIFIEEFKSIFIICFCFVGISIFKIIINNVLRFDFLISIFKIFLPIIITFFIVNTLNYKEIDFLFKSVLLISIIGYVIQIGIKTFTIENLFSISFSNSYSPFESNNFAGIACVSCFYFNYFRKNSFLSILATIFCLLTFKRLSILFAIITFILPIFVNPNKRIKSISKNIFPIIFFVSTIFYCYLLIPENQFYIESIFNVSLSKLTMGRSELLKTLMENTWINNGIGSIQFFLGRNLEMELIQFYLEVSFVGLFIFCWEMWKITSNKLYSIIVMLFVFINLLTSHSLQNSFNWIMYYLMFYCIKNFDFKKSKMKVLI